MNSLYSEWTPSSGLGVEDLRVVDRTLGLASGMHTLLASPRLAKDYIFLSLDMPLNIKLGPSSQSHAVIDTQKENYQFYLKPWVTQSLLREGRVLLCSLLPPTQTFDFFFQQLN